MWQIMELDLNICRKIYRATEYVIFNNKTMFFFKAQNKESKKIFLNYRQRIKVQEISSFKMLF